MEKHDNKVYLGHHRLGHVCKGMQEINRFHTQDADLGDDGTKSRQTKSRVGMELAETCDVCVLIRYLCCKMPLKVKCYLHWSVESRRLDT